MRKYYFKTNGSCEKDSNHCIDMEYYSVALLWSAVNVHGLTINKEKLDILLVEFENFVKEKSELNLKGDLIISHFSSIDIGGELIFKFLENKS